MSVKLVFYYVTIICDELFWPKRHSFKVVGVIVYLRSFGRGGGGGGIKMCSI